MGAKDASELRECFATPFLATSGNGVSPHDDQGNRSGGSTHLIWGVMRRLANFVATGMRPDRPAGNTLVRAAATPLGEPVLRASSLRPTISGPR
jgi:hypothetical protein